MNEPSDPTPGQRAPVVLARNRGKPIKLQELKLVGVSTEAAQGGDPIKICTRLSLTSDDRLFLRIVEGLNGHILHHATKAGHAISLTRANTVLLVIHPDNTGDLWLDAAAVVLEAQVKRPMAAGTILFENDIADVTAMSFPFVQIGEKDHVVCIFREGWRFGLFFDFNPDGNLSIENMERDLGTLYRRIKYRDFYEAISDESVFGPLVEAGWFPFVEILGAEFRSFLKHCEAGFGLDEIEVKLITAFDEERLEVMFMRWMAKPHFAGKEMLLRSAFKNFRSGDAVAVLKIILTEIEGILREAYRMVYGKGAKLPELLEFAVQSAEGKAGQSDTLLFPGAFAQYLKSHTFSDFNPVTRTGKASSRHAVGHGEADPDSYTQVRALQALLTLDQLAFYT